MSETSDQRSMHVAMQTIETEAHGAHPEQAAGTVLQGVLARLWRGIEDARSKGCTDTQIAYLIDLHAVLTERQHHLAGAVGASGPAPQPEAPQEEDDPRAQENDGETERAGSSRKRR